MSGHEIEVKLRCDGDGIEPLVQAGISLELDTTILLSLLRNKSWWGTILRRALSERNFIVEQAQANVIKKGPR